MSETQHQPAQAGDEAVRHDRNIGTRHNVSPWILYPALAVSGLLFLATLSLASLKAGWEPQFQIPWGAGQSISLGWIHARHGGIDDEPLEGLRVSTYQTIGAVTTITSSAYALNTATGSFEWGKFLSCFTNKGKKCGDITPFQPSATF